MIKKIRKSLIIASLSISIGLFSTTNTELNGVEIVHSPVQAPLPSLTLEIGPKSTTTPGASNRSNSNSKRSQSPASGRANSSSGRRELKGYSSDDLADPIEQNTEKDPKEVEKDAEDDKAKAVGCMCMRKTAK